MEIHARGVDDWSTEGDDDALIIIRLIVMWSCGILHLGDERAFNDWQSIMACISVTFGRATGCGSMVL